MTQRITVKISDELNEFLDNESKRTGISKSSLVAFAIEEYKNYKHYGTINLMRDYLQKRDLEI